jgi:hypothetical protein
VDIKPVLQYASDVVDSWLEGYRERTRDFQRRVRLAEPAFLAVCEALLAYDPPRGAELWRALRATMATRYIGAAGIDELLHLVFRAPESPAVAELRDETIDLTRCHTDRALFDVAVAASYDGKAAWLTAVIEADRNSPFVWRQKRGALLSGFTVGNESPVAGAWPEGEVRTSHVALHRKAARLRWIEACAHHWWRACVAAPDPIQAYAAWVLFLRSADSRSYIWMRESVDGSKTEHGLIHLKAAHLHLNRSELKRAMEKRLERADTRFLDQDTTYGVGPWGKVSDGIR